MTNKQYHEAVLTANISDEVNAKAKGFLAQITKQDDKRADKKNELKTKIFAILKSHKKAQTRAVASEIAKKVRISTSKASYLLRVMAESGEIERFEPTKRGAPLEYVAK